MHNARKTNFFVFLITFFVATGSLCAQTASGQAPKKKKEKAPWKFTYDLKNKRNPFVPLVSDDGRFVNLEPPERKSDVMLEGIIYDPHGISCAVVNGAVVKVSDEIDGYQVLRIEKEKVIFIKEGQVSEVILKKD